jgi:hypothetical protein
MKTSQLKKITNFKAIPDRKLMFLYLSKKYYKVCSVPYLEMTIYGDYHLIEAKMSLFNYSLIRHLIDIFSVKYRYYKLSLGFESNGVFSNISFAPTFFNRYSDFYFVSYKKHSIRNAKFKFALPIFRFDRRIKSLYRNKKTIIELINSYSHLKFNEVWVYISNDSGYIIG